MDSFNELWQVVSDYLRQTNSESIYNVWFSELEPISFDGSRAVLMTTAEFKRRILAQKFGGTLHSAFLNALGLDVDVEFIAPGEGYSQSDSSGSAAGSSEIDGSTRASNYFENTFDTFVVGASNKFAHAAAQAVAANPGKAYNPLFIYGNSGLGKTHLLNAICHEIKRNDPSMKIVLTDGEEFTTRNFRNCCIGVVIYDVPAVAVCTACINAGIDTTGKLTALDFGNGTGVVNGGAAVAHIVNNAAADTIKDGQSTLVSDSVFAGSFCNSFVLSRCGVNDFVTVQVESQVCTSGDSNTFDSIIQ